MWNSESQARLLSRTLFIRSQGRWTASGPFGEMESNDLMLLTLLSASMESASALISLSEGTSGGSCVSILELSREWKEQIVAYVAEEMDLDIERMD